MPTPCSSNRSLGGWEYSGSSDLQWISMIPAVFTNRSGSHISNNSGAQRQCYCWLTSLLQGKVLFKCLHIVCDNFSRLGTTKSTSMPIRHNISERSKAKRRQSAGRLDFRSVDRIVELAEQALLTGPSVSGRGSGFFKTAHRQLWASR